MAHYFVKISSIWNRNILGCLHSLHWRFISITRMKALSVIGNFNIFKYGCLGFGTDFKPHTIQSFLIKLPQKDSIGALS